MDLTSLLSSSIGQNLISGAASQLGIEQSKAQSIISIGLPVLMSAIQKNASNPATASGLQNALESKHDGSILENLSGFLGQGDFSDGSKIIGHLLGGNSQNVVNAIGQQSGTDSSQVGNVLSMLAPVVMGMMGKQKQEQGLDMNGIAGLVGGFLGGNQSSDSNNVAMNIATKFLDQNNDGSIVDDVLKMEIGRASCRERV